MVMRIESSLRLENDSEPKGEGWWTWSVWVEGSPEDLAAVKSVTYRLHPTFPKPVVQVSDASTNFKYSASGWGEFAIAADAETEDGRAIRLERWLNLGQTGTSSTPEEKRPSVFLSYSIADSAVVNVLRDVLLKQGIDVQTAEQALAPGEEFAPQIDRKLQESDAVLAVVSNPPSRFVEQEALAAHRKGRYVLPVLLGGAEVHGPLAQLARFELPDTRNVEGLAHQIAARVKDQAIADSQPGLERSSPS